MHGVGDGPHFGAAMFGVKSPFLDNSTIEAMLRRRSISHDASREK